MSAQGRPPAHGAADGRVDGRVDGRLPSSPAALERAIEERRARLAATLEELAVRAQPREIARRGMVDVRDRIREATHQPDGTLRSERIGAVVGATVVVLGLMVWLRRRH